MATSDQLLLAERLEIPLHPDVPAAIAAAILRSEVRVPLRLRKDRPATDAQVEFIEDLLGGATEAYEFLSAHGYDYRASREIAGAWLAYLLAHRSLHALKELKPERGDVVSGAADDAVPPRIVSSVSADGRVNFRGGQGSGARPHKLRVLAKWHDESTDARTLRREAANAIASKAPQRAASLTMLRPIEPYRVDQTDTEDDARLLEEVLDKAEDERPIQGFLTQHPSLLATVLQGVLRYVIPLPRLGAEYIPDFALAHVDSIGIHWTAVELESPTKRALLENGRLADRARQGMSQIEDWREWLQHNLNYARRPAHEEGLGLPGIRPTVSGLVLVGRRDSLTSSKEGTRHRRLEEGRVVIHTYDWLVDINSRLKTGDLFQPLAWAGLEDAG